MDRYSSSTISTGTTKPWQSCLRRLTLHNIEALLDFPHFGNLFSVCVRRGAAVTPRAHPPRIDMNEGRPRVITDAAARHRQSDIVQPQGVNSRDAYVNRVSLNVLAVLRHARRARAKEFIAPGSAIPANDFDLRIRMSDRGSEIGPNVAAMRTGMFHGPRPRARREVM